MTYHQVQAEIHFSERSKAQAATAMLAACSIDVEALDGALARIIARTWTPLTPAGFGAWITAKARPLGGVVVNAGARTSERKATSAETSLPPPEWIQCELFFNALSIAEAATPAMVAAGLEVDPCPHWRDPDWDDEDGVYFIARQQRPAHEERAFKALVESVIKPFEGLLWSTYAGWRLDAWPAGLGPAMSMTAEIRFADQPSADAALRVLRAADFAAEPCGRGVTVRLRQRTCNDLADFIHDVELYAGPFGGVVWAASIEDTE